MLADFCVRSLGISYAGGAGPSGSCWPVRCCGGACRSVRCRSSGSTRARRRYFTGPPLCFLRRGEPRWAIGSPIPKPASVSATKAAPWYSEAPCWSWPFLFLGQDVAHCAVLGRVHSDPSSWRDRRRFLDKRVLHGGLALSRYAASAWLAAFIIACVFFVSQRAEKLAPAD